MTSVVGLNVQSMLTINNNGPSGSNVGGCGSSTSSPTSSSSSSSSSCGSSSLNNSTMPIQHTVHSSTSSSLPNQPIPTAPPSSKQILNISTIKMLQLSLDEASQTGEILLSAKNLNEYPAAIAAAYDLSDTIHVDMSKNHLTEFPKELYTCDSLEKLILYSNQIRLIPEIAPFQLHCLRTLDLNSNNLSYLPPCLCNLVSLQVLTVNNNKLVSLPEEIGSLSKLIQLDVSCNEITHLPIQLGDLVSLRSLNVRRNLLVELPKGERSFRILHSTNVIDN
jgi:Leucine-rich repeat (LRR) protein